jgi:hypothetical protein
VEELGHDQVGDGVVDGGAEEDDAVLEQPGEDVEGALSPARLLDHDGHEVGVGHGSSGRAEAGDHAKVPGDESY